MDPSQSSMYWLQLQGRDHSENPCCPTARATAQLRAGTFAEMTTWLWSSHISPGPGHSEFPDFIPQNLEGIGKGGGSREILRDTFNSHRRQVWGKLQEQKWVQGQAQGYQSPQEAVPLAHRGPCEDLNMPPLLIPCTTLGSLVQPGQRDHTFSNLPKLVRKAFLLAWSQVEFNFNFFLSFLEPGSG